MSTRGIFSWSSACLIGACLGGCGGGGSTQPNANQPDPVQQEIERKVSSKGSQVIPPGHMMNSGGEIVPVETGIESDQQ